MAYDDEALGVDDTDDDETNGTLSLSEAKELKDKGKARTRKYTVEFTDDEVAKNNGRRFKVLRDLSLSSGLKGKLPDGGEPLSRLFKRIDGAIRAECGYEQLEDQHKKGVNGGIQNAHGAWFEWLLAIAAWNAHVEDDAPFVAVALPNRPFNVMHIYHPELRTFIDDLSKKLGEDGVRLESSNPDFVIVNAALLKKKRAHIDRINMKLLETLDSLYQSLFSTKKDGSRVGKCRYTDIVGYVGCKFSLRGDRRLQMPSEGSLMKALYSHLRTRRWEPDANGISYFAVATAARPRDREVLETVATGSIIIPTSEPERAVDWLYTIPTFQELVDMFKEI